MKVSTETVATREVVLTIEPDPKTVEQAMRNAARQISRWRPVPGFRPGRAPYGMVERMFGREVILNQALDEIAPNLFNDALAEADLEAYAQGQLEVESEDPVVLKVNVSLVPTVELGDYADLEIEPEPEVAISEEQVDEELEAVRSAHAQYNPVERPLQMGDQIIADVKGVSGDEEIVNDERVTVDVNEELDPPGFAEALVGMSAEETRQFTLTYPEDFENEELAGREVDYTVTVHTVREIELPAADDDLAKMAGDYETLSDLRETLADRLKRRLEAERQQREAEAAIEQLKSVATVEYPQAALDNEIDRQVQAQASRVQRMGLPFETYLNITGQTIDNVRDAVRPAAEQSLVERLVLSEYAEAEGLKVSEDEFQQELNVFAAGVSATYGDQAEEVLEQMAQRGALRSVYGDAVLRKAVQHLVNQLTGREEVVEAEATPVAEVDETAANVEATEIVEPAEGDVATATPDQPTDVEEASDEPEV